MEIGCEKGIDGCYKQLSPKECAWGDVCIDGREGCGPCFAQSDCGSGEVCTWSYGCTDPYIITYVVKIHSVEFPLEDENGTAWDSFGGAPEPKVCVSNGSDDPDCTGYAQDTFTATFEEELKVFIDDGEKLCITAIDVGPLENDTADGSCWDPFVGLVKQGTFAGYLYDDLVWVEFSIWPED